jgi:hypothetical protein
MEIADKGDGGGCERDSDHGAGEAGSFNVGPAWDTALPLHSVSTLITRVAVGFHMGMGSRETGAPPGRKGDFVRACCPAQPSQALVPSDQTRDQIGDASATALLGGGTWLMSYQLLRAG